MRLLTDHIVEGDSANQQLTITVTDEPGQGGACHSYNIDWYDDDDTFPTNPRKECFIGFQNGPIKECGVNGVTQEALIAIVIDRMRSFQAGPFACEENGEAMEHFKLGLRHLQSRTRKRIARGVEGTHQK